MSLNKPQSLGFFFLSMFFSMALRIAPWPPFFAQINPDWILLTLIYWALATPDRTGILSAWCIGLITDILTGRALGQYALAYPLAIYFCIKKHKRLRQFPLFQQALFIFIIQLLSQLLIFWTENFLNPTQFTAKFWWPVFTGTLAWPLVFTVLRHIRVPKTQL
jgi:rod shape-determining protein MreD